METRAINTIRLLAVDTIKKANSGHPGAPCGMAPAAYVLWEKVMHYSPSHPEWWNRDRFVLSNGHASALLYTMIHLSGYDLPMEELKKFRQLGSITPGHPERGLTPGVEVTTGPLGQGICNAIGMALASSQLAAYYNKDGFNLFDNFVYCMCGDGCLQEGVALEACSLAGLWKLGKLIVMLDDNAIQLDTPVSSVMGDDITKKFESMGWRVIDVLDADSNVAAIEAAIEEGKKDADHPKMIRLHTTIGFGSLKQGTPAVHGAPLADADIQQMKSKWGFDPAQSFIVPEDVRMSFAQHACEVEAEYSKWTEMFQAYCDAFPAESSELSRRMSGALPAEGFSFLPTFTPSSPASATRISSGQVLNALAKGFPELVGGSADLSCSTKASITVPEGKGVYTPENRVGRHLLFGVREHGMAGIANGIAAFGGFKAFVSTFANFVTYMWGSLRVSALSHLPVMYVLTHDSVYLGEDGPTHQPVEILAALRALPNIYTFRPADAVEVEASYKAAIAAHCPSALLMSRQDLPVLAHSSIEGASKGGYVVIPEEGKLDCILIASGSEVTLAVQVAAASSLNVRVVSMPCIELFDAQSPEYIRSVIVPGVPVMSIEAGSTRGWERYAHFSVGIDRFGISAPANLIAEELGFTVESITPRITKMVEKFKDGAPILPIHYVECSGCECSCEHKKRSRED